MRSIAGGTALSVVLGTVSLLGAATVPASADSTTRLPITSYSDMVVDGVHHRVFISNPSAGNIAVTDYNGVVVGRVSSEPGAAGLALSNDSATLYVALSTVDAISAIDTATLAETARYPIGTGTAPASLALAGGKIWFGYGRAGQGNIGSLDLSPQPDPTPTDTPTDPPTGTPDPTPTDTPTDPPTGTPDPTPTDTPTPEPTTTTPEATAAPSPTESASGAARALSSAPVVVLGQGGSHSWYSAPTLASAPGAPGVLAAGINSQSPTELQVYDVSSGEAVSKAYRWNPNGAGNMMDIALSPDGTQVLVASGAPYFHQVYRSSDLADDGRYPTSSYPNAVAVAPDGMVAAGIDGAYSPDIYIFPAKAASPRRTYDFGQTGGADTLAPNGLAWAPDKSRLFAITQEAFGESLTLRVLNSPTKAVSTLTVSAPATAPRAQQLTVTGRLTATVAYPAGTTVQVTRTDLTSPTGKSLGSKTVAADGTFRFTDTPYTGGKVTYTARYAGDADHTAATGSDAVEVSRTATTVSVWTNATYYSYGATATVTGHLGKAGTLAIYAKPAGGTAKLIAKARVNSSGNLYVQYRMTRNTAFAASFAGDAVSAPKSVTRWAGARVWTSTSISGYYKTATVSGVKQYYFHKTRDPLFTTSMTAAPNRCTTYSLQVYYQGAWRSAGSQCFTLSSTGKVIVQLTGTHLTGYRMRMRASYIYGSGDKLNATTYGSWKYFVFTW
jgi:hypothetical protein